MTAMDARSTLVEARRRAGLSMRQLARRANTSHSAIAAYESGAKTPTTTTFSRLVHACGFDFEGQLRPSSGFEDRAERGRELLEVLDLADEFPSEHRGSISTRFRTR
jgi:transcriptional regulator with XRE-family HTH domain